jgi:hypothetical protein
MIKRALLALALAASLGGAVVACNTPAGTASPSAPASSAAPSVDLASPSTLESAAPSSS